MITISNKDPFRIPPAMQPQAYQTYRLVAPQNTHWVKATCEEVDCEPFRRGWTSVVDEGTTQGSQTAQAIRNTYKPGSYRETKTQFGTQFSFSPGQPCFRSSSHRRRLQKPDLCIVQGGDYRGNPLKIPTKTHTKPEFWAEDFAEHQDKLAKLINGS